MLKSIARRVAGESWDLRDSEVIYRIIYGYEHTVKIFLVICIVTPELVAAVVKSKL